MTNMIENSSKVIQLVQFFVDKILFERNYGAEVAGREMQINPVMDRTVMRMDEDRYRITISISISKDQEQKDLPFRVEAAVGGVFRLTGISDEERHKALCANASAILLPYLRSTVSTAMSLAGVPPIILPVMNADKVFGPELKGYDE